MTYCVAISVDRGLIFASDSRTNAGVDQISTYSKILALANGHVFAPRYSVFRLNELEYRF